MLTKALVEKVINKHSAKVRIPIYNGIKGSAYATPEDELYTATICVPPGCEFNLQKNDVVYIDFELDEPEHPVILGLLSRDNISSTTDIKSHSLQVTVNCNLPYDTSIQQAKGKEIINKASSFATIAELLDRLTTLENEFDSLGLSNVDGQLCITYTQE